VGNDKSQTARADFWLQKWIAIAESIGISKCALLEDYYFDEFLSVLDAHNEMHSVKKDSEAVEEVDADNW
jgi:hypothetical protein